VRVVAGKSGAVTTGGRAPAAAAVAVAVAVVAEEEEAAKLGGSVDAVKDAAFVPLTILLSRRRDLWVKKREYKM
jgi:hypothetical protein